MLGLFSPFRVVRWAWRALKKALTFWRHWRKDKKKAEETGQPQGSLADAIKEEIIDELTDKK